VPTPYQRAKQSSPNRTDHVWFKNNGLFKCCLCGAVCRRPPNYPTPPDWTPLKYEPLTPEERALCPPEVF
jgi:hypothetical protein